MFCHECGSENIESSSYCIDCGEALSPGDASTEAKGLSGRRGGEGREKYARGKTPWVAVILSILIPGLGQFYNGDDKKGTLMVIAAILGGLKSFSIFWLVLMLWSAIDAYSVAKRKTTLW